MLAEPFVELGVKDNLSAALSKVKGTFLKAGALLAGAAGVGVAAAGGFLGASLPTLDDLAKLDATRKALGLTAEEATGLFGVFKANGVEFDASIGAVEHFGKAVTEAANGRGTTDVFQRLNVGAGEFNALNPSEQFYRLHDALMAVADPAERVQLLMESVGEDAGKKLVGTLSQTTDELRKQAGTFALSEQELAAATAANKAYNQATAMIGRAWQQTVALAAPYIEMGLKAVTEFLAPMKDIQKWWPITQALFELGWAKLLLGLTQGWHEFGGSFEDGWQDFVYLVENYALEMGAAFQKVWVDVLAWMKQQFGQTIKDMLGLLGRIPGLGDVALGAGVVIDVIGGNPKAVKAGIDAQLAAQQKKIQLAKDAADEARKAGRADDAAAAQARVVEATARLAELTAVNNAAAKIGDKLNKGASQLTQAAGTFGVASGFLSGIFGARSVSPQVAEQKKTNVLLGEILGAVAGGLAPKFA